MLHVRNPIEDSIPEKYEKLPLMQSPMGYDHDQVPDSGNISILVILNLSSASQKNPRNHTLEIRSFQEQVTLN